MFECDLVGVVYFITLQLLLIQTKIDILNNHFIVTIMYYSLTQ